MKPIKMFGLAALLALMALAFVGASSAMAERTGLCTSDGEPCESVVHVHETSVGKGVLLSSIATIECEVLFLGDPVAETSEPLKITGHFTYPMEGCKTTSGVLCEVSETSKEALIEVLKTASELAEVKGTAEVNAHCGTLINCTYDGEGLKGHGLGALLTGNKGRVTISEQVTHKTGGTFCPKEAKLDLTTESLESTYIVGGLHYCVEYEHPTHGFFKESCHHEWAAREYPEMLVIAPPGHKLGEHLCVNLRDLAGLYKVRATNLECKEDDKENKSLYELGEIILVE